MAQLAIVLQPTESKVLEYIAFGPYPMQEVLTVPSSRLIWLEVPVDNDAIVKELQKRFPCDAEFFTKIVSIGSSSYNSRRKVPLQGDFKSPEFTSVITRGFAARGNNNGYDRHPPGRDKMEAVYKAAKSNPVLLASGGFDVARIRQGYVVRYENMGEGLGSYSILRYDPALYEEQQAKKKKRITHSVYLPSGYAVMAEVREIVRTARDTLHDAILAAKSDDNLTLILDPHLRTKVSSCKALISLFDIGVRLFGDNFWTKQTEGSWKWVRIEGGGYGNNRVRLHPARNLVVRWKKEKRKIPESKEGQKIYGIVQQLGKAKLRPIRKRKKIKR